MPRLAPSPPQLRQAASPPRISPASSTSSPCSTGSAQSDFSASLLQRRLDRSSPPRALRPVVNTSLTTPKTQSMFDFANKGNNGIPLLAQVKPPALQPKKAAAAAALADSFSMLGIGTNNNTASDKYSFSSSIWSKGTELPKYIANNPLSTKLGWGLDEDPIIPRIESLKLPMSNTNINSSGLQLFSNEFMQYLNQIA